MSAEKNSERPTTIVAQDPATLPGELKSIGGSRSDDWNNIIANQTVHTLWVEHLAKETRDLQFGAAVQALIGIGPKDEIEGMLAAQLIAAHNAALECYRRAMIGDQTFQGRNENLNQANKLGRTYAVLLDALNRHRGKGQQKVTVEHVHVHEGGQAIVGTVETRGGTEEITGSTPCKGNWPCISANGVEQGQGAGAFANRQRCRMAAAGCTAENRRARQWEIETPTSTGTSQQTPSRAADRSQS